MISYGHTLMDGESHRIYLRDLFYKAAFWECHRSVGGVALPHDEWTVESVQKVVRSISRMDDSRGYTALEVQQVFISGGYTTP